MLFSTRREVELEDQIFQNFWFSDELPNEKMDTLLEYFGIEPDGAHDALVDVRNTGLLIMKFLKMQRSVRLATNRDGEPIIKLKGSCRRQLQAA